MSFLDEPVKPSPWNTPESPDAKKDDAPALDIDIEIVRNNTQDILKALPSSGSTNATYDSSTKDPKDLESSNFSATKEDLLKLMKEDLLKLMKEVQHESIRKVTHEILQNTINHVEDRIVSLDTTYAQTLHEIKEDSFNKFVSVNYAIDKQRRLIETLISSHYKFTQKFRDTIKKLTVSQMKSILFAKLYVMD